MLPILEPSPDDTAVERSSTALEGKHYLSVLERGVYLPIAWDEIVDYDCAGGAITKTYVLDLGDALAQDYDVQECTYTEDEYILDNIKETELHALPPEQGGDGSLFYEKEVDKQVFINAGNGSLGQRNATTLRKGLDYVRGKKVLTGDKALGKIK